MILLTVSDPSALLKAGGKPRKRKVSMDHQELVDEHRRLVRVLESDSHADDAEEAERQRDELAEYVGKGALLVTDPDLLKAVVKKLITVPGHFYMGTYVPPYQKMVNVAVDHDHAKVASGQGSYLQKEAHKKLGNKVSGFHDLSEEDKAHLILAHATDMQDAATHASAISTWKKAALAGKNPTPAEWKAFHKLSVADQGVLLMQVEKQAGGLSNLQAPSITPHESQISPDAHAVQSAPVVPPVPHRKLAAYHASMMAGTVPTPEQTADLIDYTRAANGAAIDHWSDLVKEAIGIHTDSVVSGLMGAGNKQYADHYQGKLAEFENAPAGNNKKVAIEKLKKEGGWGELVPHVQHAKAHALYLELQGAASLSSAVSGWKKKMLAGEVPSPAQAQAFQSLAAKDPAKAKGYHDEAAAKIGAAKALDLHTKALAKLGQYGQAAVLLTTEPSAAVPSTDAGIVKQAVPHGAKTVWSSLIGPGQSVKAEVHAVEGGFIASIGHLHKEALAGVWPDAESAKAAALTLGGGIMQPKPGDTKTLVGKTYILKNGRWHLVAAEQAATPDAPQPAQHYAATLHHTTDGHNKFYSVEVNGSELTKQWGKIGTNGQAVTVNYMSHAAALAHAHQLVLEKEAKGYQHVASSMDQPSAPVVATPAAPVTKPKKASKAEKAAAVEDAVHAVKIPNFLGMTSSTYNQHYQNVAHSIKHAALTGGLPAVKKLVTYWSTGEISTKVKAAGFKTGKLHPATSVQRRQALYQFCMDIKAALESQGPGVKPGSATPKSATVFRPATPNEWDTKVENGVAYVLKNGRWHKVEMNQPAAAIKPTGDPFVGNADGWVKVGEQLGGNPGGVYLDKKDSTKWYVKFPPSEDAARSEMLASKFYQMLGHNTTNQRLVKMGGKIAIASKMQPLNVDQAKLKSAPDAVLSQFIAHAWLANWDAVGANPAPGKGFDNIQFTADGAPVVVEAGGALQYTGLGAKKAGKLGHDVPELAALRDPSINPTMAAVFGKASDAHLRAGAVVLAKMHPSQIQELVEKVGPKAAEDQQTLIAALKARRAAILKQFGITDQWDKPPVDETRIKVDPASIKQPLDFFAIGSQGPTKTWVSSKEWVNQRNTEDSKALFDFAVHGNLKALQDYHYDAVDKETGKSIGKKHIKDHPSGKIQDQWAALIQGLQSIAYPPVEMLDMPSLGSFDRIDDIAAAVGAFAPGENVTTVAPEHRFGYFMKLAQIEPGDAKALLDSVQWVWHTHSTSFKDLLKNAWAKFKGDVKSYVHAVTATGAVNHMWSQGATHYEKTPLNELTRDIYKNAADLPDGTQLWRWMDDDTANQQMTKMLLAAKPGLVLQNTDSMCCSFFEHWGDTPHFCSPKRAVKMRIRYPKGGKGTPTYSTGSHTGEGEVTTLPGQRFLVVDIQKGGPKHPDGVFVDVIALPPDPGFVAKLGSSPMGKSFIETPWTTKMIVIVSRQKPSRFLTASI